MAVLYDVICYTMLHNATQCYTMLHSVTQCYTMLHNATQCYTMLHNVTQCYTLLHNVTVSDKLMLHSHTVNVCYTTHRGKDLANGCLQLILYCPPVHVATQQERHRLHEARLWVLSTSKIFSTCSC